MDSDEQVVSNDHRPYSPNSKLSHVIGIVRPSRVSFYTRRQKLEGFHNRHFFASDWYLFADGPVMNRTSI